MTANSMLIHGIDACASSPPVKGQLAAVTSGLVWPLLTFAALIVVSGIVAAVAARAWGRTKQSRQMIFTLVGFAGLVLSAAVTLARMRAHV